MTPKQRLLTTLAGEIPDCVPVAPDVSNMVPARLTGKPFWDLYLYNDPPIWEAYVHCAHRLGFDALMDGYFPLRFEDPSAEAPPERFIVRQTEDRIIVQNAWRENGSLRWADYVSVFYRADSPTWHVPLAKLGLPEIPEKYMPLEGVKPVDRGPGGLAKLKELMGDQGLVGVFLASSVALSDEEDIYRYYDQPEKHEQWAAERVEAVEKRFEQIRAMPEESQPDFLCVGGSGTLVFQTVAIFRQLCLPAVKRGIELATEAGYPTHVHSCGPETELVRIMAEETDLTVIDPLEPPPMGDCDLAEIKRRWGDRIVLKGNLHTTDVMLRGSAEEVAAASRAAIDAAAEGGRFILSTADQCGRDTPLDNLEAMIETARTYGNY